MKVLNRGIKNCGQVEVIGSVACTVQERNVSDLITRFTATSTPSTAGMFAVGCVMVHETTGHVYVNQGTVASPTFNDIGAVAADEIAIANAKILVGNASDVGAAVNVSGDATLANTGALTIASGAVGLTKLATAVAPSHVAKFAGLDTFAGGGTTDALTVTGVLATDVVLAMVATSTNACTVRAVPTTDTVTFTYSADPGAGTTVYYVVLRATA